MIRIASITLSILLTFHFSSCKKDSTSPATPTPPATYPRFSPLKTGNYWIYQRFSIDTSGTEVALSKIDSCYIEKDTVIHNSLYFKFVRTDLIRPNFSYKFVRNSLHYLVNHMGQILFSSENFEDNFDSYFVTMTAQDTVCEATVKMADKNLSVTTPAGQFQTYNFKQTFTAYPKYAIFGAVRSIDTRYAENVGIVVETFPFGLYDPYYIQRRLVRYKLN